MYSVINKFLQMILSNLKIHTFYDTDDKIPFQEFMQSGPKVFFF